MTNSLLLMLAINLVSVSFLSCEFREFVFTIKEVSDVTLLALDTSQTATGLIDCANQCALHENECFNFIFDESNYQCIMSYWSVPWSAINKTQIQTKKTTASLYTKGKFCDVTDPITLVGPGKMSSCNTSACSMFIDVGSDTTLDLNSPNVYRSCKDVTNTTLPRKLVKLTSGLVVMCDTQTDGGGWTIFQRRVSGSVNFSRNWSEYRNGFGDYGVGDFYLGNENIFCISSKVKHELRIDMKYKGESYNRRYYSFQLFSEEEGYRLSLLNEFGFLYLTDSLTFKSNNRKFSTYDRDNDEDLLRHCAYKYHSGWWFSWCHDANLNGIWGSKTFGETIEWLSITGELDSLEFTEMKIRPLH